MVLERIQKENDIQNIAKDELPVLAQEIRNFLWRKSAVPADILRPTLVWWN